MPAKVGLELALLELQKISVFPLPAAGRVTIGRATDNDICIEDDSVSRRHAILHLGDTVRVEDLDSSNGTFVRRDGRVASSGVTKPDMARVAPGETVELPVGEGMRLGSQIVVIRPTTAVPV